MPARRLIIVMVVLLGVSTLLAAVLPGDVRRAGEEKTASESSTTSSDAAQPGPTATKKEALCGRCLKPETIDADEPTIVAIRLEAGQQLPLTVVSSSDDLVEIQRIGFVDVVGPDKPATFDILTNRPGSYGVKLLEADRIIGRLEVTKAAPGASEPASAGESP